MLTKSTLGELLSLLGNRSKHVSSVLIKKEESHQKKIYYVSKVLHGVEQRYPEDGGNWLLHVDGSSTLTANGVGVVLTSPERDELEYALHINFKASNNEAKYESLIASIRIAFAYSDSRLVTNQVEGKYEVKEERMK
ncbi:UNVERIFIED_CONTAM: hypothetical protein Sangu_2515400 [Sesamum angustifolium]|uniref:RNase H type-1 domain-containing protein n=1 Tax=Sesamum angustifolium TaxID=2727405 RepID=A0AAW2JKW6_9LAMI